jgi:hypothetical protein
LLFSVNSFFASSAAALMFLGTVLSSIIPVNILIMGSKSLVESPLDQFLYSRFHFF